MSFRIVNGPTVFVIMIHNLRKFWNKAAEETRLAINENTNMRVIIDNTKKVLHLYRREAIHSGRSKWYLFEWVRMEFCTCKKNQHQSLPYIAMGCEFHPPIDYTASVNHTINSNEASTKIFAKL